MGARHYEYGGEHGIMMNGILHLFKRRGVAGFSFSEVLAAAAIIGVLAAIAVPFTLRQQARADEVAVRADLTDVAAAIAKAERNWRSKAPGMWLFICHAPYESQYPTGSPRTNTCLDGAWDAKRSGGQTVPNLSGKTRNQNIVQGVVAPDGSYCLDGRSPDSGISTFYLDSDSPESRVGTCLDAEWVPTGGIRGNTKAGYGTEPQPGISGAAVPSPVASDYLPTSPLGLQICVYGQAGCTGTTPTTRQTAVISWNASPGVTYQIDVSGQPSRYASITSGTRAECWFPANQCTGPFYGQLPKGTYQASVRVKNGKGWSPYATQLFTIS